ncbi:hypothetical protein CI238_12951 [Colletotrichum incanum]|uniref:Uncharacterized protein n=1 Tax=Colletotrichum incanum TaxID=1573173 RepID=A0A167AYE4_COLIC|nr:hypothetical protein CI238_12951 [Colletotrichum incanum]
MAPTIFKGQCQECFKHLQVRSIEEVKSHVRQHTFRKSEDLATVAEVTWMLTELVGIILAIISYCRLRPSTQLNPEGPDAAKNDFYVSEGCMPRGLEHSIEDLIPSLQNAMEDVGCKELEYLQCLIEKFQIRSHESYPVLYNYFCLRMNGRSHADAFEETGELDGLGSQSKWLDGPEHHVRLM